MFTDFNRQTEKPCVVPESGTTRKEQIRMQKELDREMRPPTGQSSGFDVPAPRIESRAVAHYQKTLVAKL
jgi:hypothetical protein